MRMRLVVFAIFCVALLGSYGLYRWGARSAPRTVQLIAWFNDPSAIQAGVMQAGGRCGDAPWMFPTDGYVGFLWGDSFRPGHTHQGIDIFSGTDAGVTPVYAVAPGYLTRQIDWKSSLIIRIPSDPLAPGRQIWIYYTHLADAQGRSFIAPNFPPGSREVYVERGTFLGYQGDYSGNPANPVGVHLHLSVVKDLDGEYLNELEIDNTYDPSPYLGLPLNAYQNPDQPAACQP